MPLHAEKPTVLTLQLRILPEAASDFVAWQGKFNSKIVAFPGFISLEFLSPSGQQEEWVVVQRLTTPKAALQWQESEERVELMAELKNYLAVKQITEITTQEANMKCGVTEVFITQVTPGKEEFFQTWSAKIHEVEAKFPGFRGMYMQAPQKGGNGHWITLLQFDSLENLDRWLESSERLELLNEVSPHISSLENNRIVSPYAGWFASIAKISAVPPVWKQTMLVLLVLFPIIMLEFKYLNPLVSNLNISLRTFIGNAISVTLIAFPMMPIAIWLLGWWLMQEAKHDYKYWNLIGTIIVLILYLLEIIIFWSFI